MPASFITKLSRPPLPNRVSSSSLPSESFSRDIRNVTVGNSARKTSLSCASVASPNPEIQTSGWRVSAAVTAAELRSRTLSFGGGPARQVRDLSSMITPIS